MGVNRNIADFDEKANERCTVFVASCDAYTDVWDLFFEALRVQWPDREYPVMLCTESLKYDYKDMGIQTLSLYKGKRTPAWGARLKDHLKCLSTEYVLLLLDDFIMTDKVDTRALSQCIAWMDKNTDIACFYFCPINNGNFYIRDGLYPGFARLAKESAYRFSCHAGLWRRIDLIKSLRDFETPWQWELNGTVRSRRMRKHFYALDIDAPKVFSYSEIIRRGLFKDEAGLMYEKYNLPMPVTRGLWDRNNQFRLKPTYDLREHFPRDVLTIQFFKTLFNKAKMKIDYYRSIL